MEVEEGEDAVEVTRGPYSLPRIGQNDQSNKGKVKSAAIKETWLESEEKFQALVEVRAKLAELIGPNVFGGYLTHLISEYFTSAFWILRMQTFFRSACPVHLGFHRLFHFRVLLWSLHWFHFRKMRKYAKADLFFISLPSE